MPLTLSVPELMSEPVPLLSLSRSRSPVEVKVLPEGTVRAAVELMMRLPVVKLPSTVQFAEIVASVVEPGIPALQLLANDQLPAVWKFEAEAALVVNDPSKPLVVPAELTPFTR